MAARGWLKCSAAQDDATASRVSCVQSASLHVSVPSTAWPQLTVVTAGQSHLTVLKVWYEKKEKKKGKKGKEKKGSRKKSKKGVKKQKRGQSSLLTQVWHWIRAWRWRANCEFNTREPFTT